MICCKCLVINVPRHLTVIVNYYMQHTEKCHNKVCLFSVIKMLITYVMLRKPLQCNLHSHKNICTDILTEHNTQPIKNKLKMLPTKTKSYRKAAILIFSLKYADHFKLQATHRFWTTHLITMIRNKSQ